MCVCVKHRPATGNYVTAGWVNRCTAECADKSKHESTGVNILSHLLWMRSLCQQRERPGSVFALPSAVISKYTSRALVSCCTVSESHRYIPPRRTRKLFKLDHVRDQQNSSQVYNPKIPIFSRRYQNTLEGATCLFLNCKICSLFFHEINLRATLCNIYEFSLAFCPYPPPLLS